jgi:hypothetical protein
MKRLYSIITIIDNCVDFMKTYGNRTLATATYREQLKKHNPDINRVEMNDAMEEKIHFVGSDSTINFVEHVKSK